MEVQPATERPEILIFLHGRLGQGAMWDSARRELQSQFRCLFIDFPGFGKSFSSHGHGLSLLDSANLVNMIIEKLQPEGHAILVGHDFGGAIAQLCALQYPDRISALILANSSCLSQETDPVFVGYQGLAIRWRLYNLFRQAEQLESQPIMKLRTAWKSGITRIPMVHALQILERSWPGLNELNIWRKALGTLPHPVLLLWGTQDDIIPTRIGFELMQRLPEAYYYENHNCGHWPSLEDPAWLTGKIREFIFRQIPLMRATERRRARLGSSQNRKQKLNRNGN